MLLASYRAEVEGRWMPFSATDGTLSAVRAVARALTADGPAFGIMLCGLCGLGKTTMLRAVRTAASLAGVLPRLETVRAADLPAAARDGREFRRLAGRVALAVDDVGVEPREVLDYGNPLSPFAELLERRYEERLFTIVSTNLTPGEVTERYGVRVGDRCAEMFEVVVFGGESFRRAPGRPAAGLKTASTGMSGGGGQGKSHQKTQL